MPPTVERLRNFCCPNSEVVGPVTFGFPISELELQSLTGEFPCELFHMSSRRSAPDRMRSPGDSIRSGPSRKSRSQAMASGRITLPTGS